jgi:hyaluronan synthase
MFDFLFGKKTKKEHKKEEPVHDILMHQSPDRRLLPHMPGKHRSGKSRRAISDDEVKKYPYLKFFNGEDANVRYDVRYPVTISVGNSAVSYSGYASDISITGMKLHTSLDAAEEIAQNHAVTLAFIIEPGTVPEGLEMKVKTAAHAAWPNQEVVQQKLADVRSGKLPSDTEFIFGMQFEHNLLEYSNRHHARSELMMACLLLFAICLGVILMRTESVIYFKFNKYLYLYSIIASTFLLTKYAFGFFYKPVPADEHYTPGVTIIVPCFNEETWIRQTILNAMDQYYPQDKLEVIVVDDCSTDNSAKVIKETIQDIINQEGPEVAARISYILQPVNKGKRDALALGAEHARHELLVFVDSDSFLNPYAIINLVQPFKDEQVGGVSGRTDVANTYTNSLTKMQSVRYYIAFRVMKAAEGLFDAVSCLSGPLSCYRKDLVLKYSDAWLNQKFLGQRATFGDDRSMTNFILRHNRTDYQDTAICYTIVPNDYDVFLKQQMRWKRSWLRESLIAGSFMWKKEPFAAISFYMGLLVPIVAPFIVCYNLLYIPITHRVFPTAFIIGMILMAMLMSACQSLLRRSTTWLYGIWFCIYYEMVLLWQMPIAWFTFWKSTWGTRMTPADLAEQARKMKDKQTDKPKVAGMAEQVALDEEAETSLRDTVAVEAATAGQAIPANAESPVLSSAEIAVAGRQTDVITVQAAGQIGEEIAPAVAKQAEVLLANEVKETVVAVPAQEAPKDKAAALSVEQDQAVSAVHKTVEETVVAAKPATDKVAEQKETTTKVIEEESVADRVTPDKTEKPAVTKVTREIFNPEAAPYIDTQRIAQSLNKVQSTPLTEELRREQDALIELIRENQRQVAELHKLMEQRIELEKMRIAAYENTLAAERENVIAAERRNALNAQKDNIAQNAMGAQEVDEP